MADTWVANFVLDATRGLSVGNSIRMGTYPKGEGKMGKGLKRSKFH